MQWADGYIALSSQVGETDVAVIKAEGGRHQASATGDKKTGLPRAVGTSYCSARSESSITFAVPQEKLYRFRVLSGINHSHKKRFSRIKAGGCSFLFILVL